eukprot:Rhum_TRINITY_DN15109_c7_g5::Rhum_TRINITY_DN15109_c7_g5_i1::g.140307::m.140307/K21777/CCNB; G2/mitotic-specific cyclin-B, other
MAQFRPALSDITTYSSFSNPNVAYAGALKPGARAAAAPSAGASSAVAPAGVAAPSVPVLPAAAAVVHADARNCDDFVEGVMENLRAEQSRGKVPENHLQICQTEVTDKMRAILIDWLVDVHLKYKCRPETIYLAVNLLDRYLSRKAVEKKKLQLVGCVAMMLACKYEEVVPPEVRDFVHISANTYTRGEMLAMEKSVLVELGYNLTVPTMWQFLTQLIGGERTDTMRHGAEYLAEQTLMCAKMAGFPPSLQAAACVYLSRKVLGAAPVWPQDLEDRSTHSERSLFDVVQVLDDYLRKVPRLKICAVRKKYSHSRYSNISQSFDVYAGAP